MPATTHAVKAPATVNNHLASLSAFTTWVAAQAPAVFPVGDPANRMRVDADELEQRDQRKAGVGHHRVEVDGGPSRGAGHQRDAHLLPLPLQLDPGHGLVFVNSERLLDDAGWPGLELREPEQVERVAMDCRVIVFCSTALETW